MSTDPMRDVIVLIPGILGSVLVKNGREVWGVSGQSVKDNLLTFGAALKRLELEPGVGHADPKDGVTAPRILPRLYMIPTFWKANGYGKLTERLSRRFALNTPTDEQPGNLIEFAYDWRLSNQFNGQRLADVVIPHLDRWRRHIGDRDAKLILICHSMGGLVARWFLEVLGGREVTRTLITIGTPYRGSINALSALVNGVSLGLGPIAIPVDKLVRSFPSVYQLLPTYDCLDLSDGRLRDLSGVDLPNIRRVNIEEGLAMHSRISSTVEENSCYKTFAIKGIDQPTNQSALLRGGQLEVRRSYKGTNYEGDGTVPRPSSHPPEWENDETCIFVSQMHALLQSTDSILTQLSGIFTGHLGKFMGGARIGVDAPPIVEVGQPLLIEVTSKDCDPSLPLHVICESENGKKHAEPVLMRASGDGRYCATVNGLSEGAWRITVQSATPRRPVEPVSDWIAVWNSTAPLNDCAEDA